MDVQWPLLIFGLLAGLGMGCLGFVSISALVGKYESLRVTGLVIALIALCLGGVASALHMGNPGRILFILGNLRSGIAQE
ncbi:MAG: dimethyl sulfoxide reductase anchor subunit, partial [Actinobacteria bacterium]|nr:dimethyl sulfoxide reductase anchor subunit [Actinomycetota bacterium]